MQFERILSGFYRVEAWYGFTEQPDVPEALALEDRIKFYESTGAYKDMVVPHLFQVLAFMAMEPPTSLTPGPIGDEKLKVFASMRPIEPHNVALLLL